MSHPDDFGIRLDRAKEYLNLQMFQEALNDANLCAKLNPKDMDLLIIQLKSNFHLKNYKKSQEILNLIVRSKEVFQESKLYQAKINLAQGNFDAALKDFKAFVKLLPESKEAYMGMGSCYMALGESKLASACFSMAN